MANWLTDERRAMIAAANPDETTEGWIRQALTLVWARRDTATNLSAEEAGLLAALDRLLTIAIATEARTPKMQMVAEPYATGPQLVRDTMATFDDGDPDGA